jgi:uncharacterized protein YcfJ
MNVISFVSSKTFAGVLTCALAATLAGCGSSTPNNAAQSAPAQNPPPVQQAPNPSPSMSVAELTANAPAPNAPPNAPAQNLPPPNNAAPNAPPVQQQGTLASTGYAPRPGSAPPPQQQPDNGEYAQVISVTPLSGTQRICTDQTVTERRPQSDNHQVAGTVIGAIAGGVIGNQVGGGNGRKLTTVAGAIGGGIAGKKIQEANQNNDTVTRVVKRCRDVVPGKDSPQLYDVVYAYQGQNLHVKLDYDPGNRIALPVRGLQ